MASLPYPRCPPNSFHRTHSKFVCASLPTDFTEYTEASGVEEPPTDAHRCAQMVRLRRVLWEDSLVAAWVWQGCHTLLICAYLRNLWENILRQKLLWVLWLLWEDSFVAAWVWQGCHTLLICVYPCNLWENTLRQKLLWVLWLLWEDSLVAA